MKRSIALAALLSAAVLLIACGGAAVRGGLPQGEPAQETPLELQIETAGGLPEMGRRLADLLRSSVPDAQSGRLALFWSRSSPWLSPLGDGFSANWPSCLLGEDLGIAARRVEEAYVQLDPANFSRLLWVEPLLLPSGDLTGLSVELRTLGPGPSWSSSIACRPALALGAKEAPTRAHSALPDPWATLDEAPRALLWESSGSRLWAASPKRISRLDAATRRAVQEWGLPDLGPQGLSARAILADLSEDTAVRVGWFDLERAQGRVYQKGGGDLFEAAETTDGFPLPPRVQRFLTAPFDAETREFVLTDFKGQEIARCLDMVRFSGPEGTLFALLGTQGNLTVLKGGDLGLLNGPVAFPVSAVTGAGPLLLLASALPPHGLSGFRLNARGAWTEVWSAGPLPRPAVALSAGGPPGAPTLFVSLNTDSGGAVFAFPLSVKASP